MRGRFLVSFPERLVRSLIAVVGGTVHETAHLVLPRLVRRSRFYEATAKNLLRITIELVGGVERAAGVEPEGPAAKPPGRGSGAGEGARGNREVPSTDHLGARQLAVRKGAGNIVELG